MVFDMVVVFLSFFTIFQCLSQRRVVNGELSLPNMFPHVASIVCEKSETCPDENFCGGGLINENTVLLAAHCISNDNYVRDPSTLTVQIGTTDVSNQRNGIVARGKSAVTHPLWKPAKVDGKYLNDFDIALLTLDQSILENGETVRFMDIIPNNIAQVGKNAVVSGWGYYSTSFKRDFHLRHAVVPVRKGSVCANHQLQFEKGIMICAGDGKVDSCHGDSGVPLVMLRGGIRNRPKRWTSVGITSFGTTGKCGGKEKESFGVYTNTSAFYEWILNYTSLPPPPDENMTVLPHLSLLNQSLSELFVEVDVPVVLENQTIDGAKNGTGLFFGFFPIYPSYFTIILFGFGCCCIFLFLMAVTCILFCRAWKDRERKQVEEEMRRLTAELEYSDSSIELDDEVLFEENQILESLKNEMFS